nr:unnamed protein product [Digitaria exilis]
MAAAAAVPNGHPTAGEDAPPASSSSLVFLGTGCSSAVPNARCLIQPPDPPCPVCSQSLSVPPELNPNYRYRLLVPLMPLFPPPPPEPRAVLGCVRFCRREVFRLFFTRSVRICGGVRSGSFGLLLDSLLVSCRCNTSLLIDYCQDGGVHKYIIIDVGKTFREQVLRWFVRHKIPCVDSQFQSLVGANWICSSWIAYTGLVSLVPSVTGSHNVHLCWDQTLDAVKRICPKRALLIGLTHEMDHHKDNQTLEEWSRR